MEEGCGEDDEEEANGEDLKSESISIRVRVNGDCAYEGERYDCLEACRHCSAEESISGWMPLLLHTLSKQCLVAEAQTVVSGSDAFVLTGLRRFRTRNNVNKRWRSRTNAREQGEVCLWLGIIAALDWDLPELPKPRLHLLACAQVCCGMHCR